MLIEIKNRFTGAVLFAHDAPDNCTKVTLMLAPGQKADLSGANLSEADLRWADLSGANLSEADLRWADLSGANLSGANLRWANLSGADLSEADLSGADLRWANLSEADLSEANLSGADLSGAAIARNHAPLYQVAGGIGECGRPLTVHAFGDRADWRWFIGCFNGSEDELRAEINRRHRGSASRRDSCLLAVEYLVNLAAMLADGK